MTECHAKPATFLCLQGVLPRAKRNSAVVVSQKKNAVYFTNIATRLLDLTLEIRLSSHELWQAACPQRRKVCRTRLSGETPCSTRRCVDGQLLTLERLCLILA